METLLDRLHQLAGFSDSQGSLDEQLSALATLAAASLDAAQCSIMLYAESAAQLRLRVCASHGLLPDAAFAERVAHGEGIAGHVAASGIALLVEDISASPFATLARHDARVGHSLMAAPVCVDGKSIGVINVTQPHQEGRVFTPSDLSMLKIVALFVGKSIQVVQLQNLLNSRFAQIALAQEAEKAIGGVMLAQAYDTDKMARIVAKSFFREMTQAGFGARQIIQAASEIISQLSGSLNKHSKRLKK